MGCSIPAPNKSAIAKVVPNKMNLNVAGSGELVYSLFMSRTKNPAKVELETLTARIRAKLLVDPAWIEAAILRLYELQTSDEQAAKMTGHTNCQGFNKPDASRMSFVATFLRNGGHLTQKKALEVYGPRLGKYAGQLAKIARAKRQAADENNR